jgi:hypothetical protein
MGQPKQFQARGSIYSSGPTPAPEINVDISIPLPDGAVILGGGYTLAMNLVGGPAITPTWNITKNGPSVSQPTIAPSWDFFATTPANSSATITNYVVSVSYVEGD